MSPGADGLDAEVVLVVEQLRRPVPGGVGTYVRGLISGLLALGEDRPPLRLLASKHAGSGRDPLAAFGLALSVSPLPSRLLVKAWDLGLLGLDGSASLTHALSLASPPSAAPLVVTVHDLAWRALPDAYPRRGRRWHEAALRRAARHAAGFVVPSAEVGAALVAATGVAPARVRAIGHGADHLPSPDLDGAQEFLERGGVTGPFLLSVSTLEPRKNLARLVSAYTRARPRLAEPWPLVVLGPSGWVESGISTTPPEAVYVLGRPSDAVLAGCYHLARLLAYVPLLEGFGLPVLEAMAAGLPVVSSDVPAAGSSTLRVEATDVDSIADGLVAAAGDETLRARLVADGLARAEAATWRRSAAEHVRFWHEVVEGRLT